MNIVVEITEKELASPRKLQELEAQLIEILRADFKAALKEGRGARFFYALKSDTSRYGASFHHFEPTTEYTPQVNEPHTVLLGDP